MQQEPPHIEEEYTDYSCSTAVERLSRDIESLLRSWHIHNGCDRHFNSPNNGNGLTLLRAERLTWVASLPDRQPLRLELELSLWDGPASSKQPSKSKVSATKKGKRTKQKKRSSVTLETSKKIRTAMRKMSRRGSLSNDECQGVALEQLIEEDEEEEEKEYHSHIPKSLRRPQEQQLEQAMVTGCLFDNFSTLFGIGQHLTLTPTNPLIDLGLETHDCSSASASSLLTEKFLGALMQRHSPPIVKWALTQQLASWLQTALNCALVNCHCCLPAFGLWGHYPTSMELPAVPQEDHLDQSSSSSSPSGLPAQHEVPIYPAWLEAARSLRLPTVVLPMSSSTTKRRSGKHRKNKKGKKLSPRKSLREYLERREQCSEEDVTPVRNSHYLPPCVTGSVLPVQNVHANFTCSVLPVPLKDSNLRLSHWGDLLRSHCPREDSTVVLAGARHVYAWQKANNDLHPSSSSHWRGDDAKDYWRRNLRADYLTSSSSSSLLELEKYRRQCRAIALELLEEATNVASGQQKQYCWGPLHDPIAAIHVNVLWTGGINTGQQPSLMSFPYPVHNIKSEVSMEQSVLDPLQAPSKFRIRIFLDHQSLEPTLATTQRCVLACLIRTATLAPLTLLRHLLWEEDIVEDWDHDSGNAAALQLANQAQVGDSTHTLVDVMDWKTCAEEMISLEEAEAIVEEVLEGWRNFPAPPEGNNMFAAHHRHESFSASDDPLLAPLLKSAPLGRLVSDLLVRMAGLRAPCSMALVWSTFCNELRQRWDAREPLPHMSYVPGLDPSPQALKERRQVSTIGLKADLASIWGGTEPNPDGQHCIIGQKLQLFNIGVETATNMEAQARNHQCRSESTDDSYVDEGISGTETESITPMPKRAASIVSLSSEIPGTPLSTTAKSSEVTGERIVDLSSLSRSQVPTDLFRSSGREHGIIDGLLPTETALTGESGEDPGESDDHKSTSSDSASSAEFYDAEECGLSVFSSPSTLFAHALATSVVHRIERKGARCPVPGCSLVASGDALFAPYLQRPQPLTDDLILERRSMLSDQFFDSEINLQDKGMPVQKRLEIAYRLQKPKLLSDMNAFKAANPGAVFQDFVNWYGNPGNPLDEYSPQDSSLADGMFSALHHGTASADSASLKLDKATEAIHILTETRNFWSCTWDEAVPIPASEQKALYDVYSAVEMAIDYLENMHPAILLNQIMAVNFSNAYFMLVASAKDATKVEVVYKSLARLRKATEDALELLAEEASNATCSFYHYTELEDNVSNFVSVEAIAACEGVCSSLSEAEVMVSLATSLLQKFPGQYEFIQTISRESNGSEIDLHDLRGRTCILDTILKQQQQQQQQQTQVSSPMPVLREYLLRNIDDSNPCQLSVRYGDANASRDGVPGKDSAALIIALTKSRED